MSFAIYAPTKITALSLFFYVAISEKHTFRKIYFWKLIYNHSNFVNCDCVKWYCDRHQIICTIQNYKSYCQCLSTLHICPNGTCFFHHLVRGPVEKRLPQCKQTKNSEKNWTKVFTYVETCYTKDLPENAEPKCLVSRYLLHKFLTKALFKQNDI